MLNRDKLPTKIRIEAERADRTKQRSEGLHKWVGLTVKVGFAVEINTGINKEWMYVLVERVVNGRLIGRLRNTPFYVPDLACGDEVVFGEDEIGGVASDDGDDVPHDDDGVAGEYVAADGTVWGVLRSPPTPRPRRSRHR